MISFRWLGLPYLYGKDLENGPFALTQGLCVYSFCPPDDVHCLCSSSIPPLAGVLPGKADACADSTFFRCPSVPILVVTKLCWFLFRPRCIKAICVLCRSIRKPSFFLILGLVWQAPEEVCVCSHSIADYILSPWASMGSNQGPDMDPWLSSSSQALWNLLSPTQTSYEPLLMQNDISTANPTVMSDKLNDKSQHWLNQTWV